MTTQVQVYLYAKMVQLVELLGQMDPDRYNFILAKKTAELDTAIWYGLTEYGSNFLYYMKADAAPAVQDMFKTMKFRFDHQNYQVIWTRSIT